MTTVGSEKGAAVVTSAPTWRSTTASSTSSTRYAVRRVGADVILDNIGAKYLSSNVDVLATEGRLVVIGLKGGRKGELDLGTLMRKRGAVISTLLRPRPVEAKAAIVASVEENVWPLVADGTVRPIVHATVPLDEVRRAHEIVEASSHIGKVVLTTDARVSSLRPESATRRLRP